MSTQDQLRSVFTALPFPCMLLDTDLVITEVSGAYAQTMDRSRAELVGRYLFDAFPLPEDAGNAAGTGDVQGLDDEEPDSPSAQDPLLLVRASMQRVLATGHSDPVPLQKYDIPDPDSPTGFQERWWSFTTFPVTDAAGVVTALLHVTEDVTKEVTGLPQRAGLQIEEVADQVASSTAALRGRAQQLEADLYERAVQVQLLTAAREDAAAHLAGLARTALALADAATVTDLATATTDHGLATTGCNSGAVAVFSPDDPAAMDLTITDGFGAATQRDYARLPADSHLPACVAATTGEAVLLADAAASRAWGPEMDAVMTSTGSQAFACLPLTAGGRRLGSLTAGWRSPQPFDTSQVELLEALAAQCAQALDRLLVREAERAAAAAEHRAAAQQSALVAVARALGSTDSEEEVLDVVATRGVDLLEATGSGLCLRDADGAGVRTLATDTFSASLRAQVQHLPADFPLPVVDSAATGAAHYLSDRAQTVERFPGAEALYTAAGMQASASVPLRARDQLLGSLSVGFTRPRAWPQEDRDLLEAFASLTAQALERLAARDAERVSREAERAASAEVARFSETLQRSLLTAPPQPDHLQIEVRYTPATAQAQVGGDWYDAFITDDGTTSLVIGDVTGHDQRAAAVMAQMRNLLRGIGYTVGDPPALVLSALDRAVHALGVDGMATAVLAQVEQPAAHRAAGTRVLHWSNAGHPAPLLLQPGRTPRFLETPPDLLLGLDPDAARDDHRVVLEPGATLLMFTDGLIERRGVSLEEGTAWLAAAAQSLVDLPLQDLCDELLAQVEGRVEDDVALLALRAHPEDGPRPVEAGPGFDPRAEDTVDSEQPR